MSSNNQKPDNSIVGDIVDVFSLMIIEIVKVLSFLFVALAKWGGKKIFKLENRSPVEERDLRKKKTTKENGTLGWLVKASRPFKEEDFNSGLHTMVIGPTGYGKTNLMTLLQERTVKLDHSVVFFDPKASTETKNMFTEVCALSGKKVYYFNEFVDNPCTFNPLLDGNIDQICDRIINACNWSDNYYKATSINILKEVLYYLKTQNEVITLKKIETELEKRKDKKNFLGLLVQIGSANMSEFGPLINSDDPNALSFRKIREENACLYIGISSLGYSETAKFFNRMFMDNLLFHCYESLQGEIKSTKDMASRSMSVYFDELSSIITPKFIELQNKCRAAGIDITYATQCPSDLKAVSPELMDQIFENTENLFIFKHMMPIHTEYLSRMVGTSKENKETYSTENGFKSDRGSVREVERLNLHPNILRRLRVGQCIFVCKKKQQLDILNVREHERKIIRIGTSSNRRSNLALSKSGAF
jgi:type IV secretory pathway TraG/TraD family ATPase VirD4